MSKDNFSVEKASPLSSVGTGGKIHVIGVCGVAMAQIAVALSESTYQVSGSDKEFYEPMKSFLGKSSVKTTLGFAVENIPEDVSLVVIGNSISYGNVEVECVEKRNLPYTLFPKLLSESIIGERHSIVVAGTHGKTTTSALATTLFLSAGKDPSCFIGGAAKGIEKSLSIGSGSVSIVEGDEYDSAFFAKVPKFDFYKPKTVIVTSIEYDHADIYPSLESIIAVFEKMLSSIPQDGQIICCTDCPNIQKLSQEWRKKFKAPVVTYGVRGDADVRIASRRFEGAMQDIEYVQGGDSYHIKAPVMGIHNARNVIAAMLAARHAGLSGAEIANGFLEFKGVRRRQDIRAARSDITLIEDFAHHPTAVLETLAAIREQYGNKKIRAIFEPRSNTSRRKVFQKGYVESFQSSDEVILCNVAARQIDKDVELMNVQELSDAVSATGKPCRMFSDPDAIHKYCRETMKAGDVFVVMSNGSFGGLIEKLEHLI